MLLNKSRNILAQADSQSLMHSSIESVRQQHLIHQITWNPPSHGTHHHMYRLHWTHPHKWRLHCWTSNPRCYNCRLHETDDHIMIICKNYIAGHETDDHITISISAPQWPSINGASQSINALDPNTLQCQWCTRWVSDSAHWAQCNEYENGRHSWRNHLDCLLCAGLCAEIPSPMLQKSCKHIWGVTYVYDSQESDIA